MPYGALLTAHSWDRWVVLVMGLLLVLVGAAGWIRRSSDTKLLNGISIVFIIALDVQLLLGFALYFIAPTTTAFMADPGGSMPVREIRFWGVEHTFGMIVAIVLAHIGRVKIRKGKDAVSRHRAAVVFVGIALLIMLLSIPWPGLPYGRPLLRF